MGAYKSVLLGLVSLAAATLSPSFASAAAPASPSAPAASVAASAILAVATVPFAGVPLPMAASGSPNGPSAERSASCAWGWGWGWCWSLDLLKAAIGTFLGAGLAFWSAMRQQRQKEAREQIAAGNMALFKLHVLHGHTRNVRKNLRGYMAAGPKSHPGEPLWFLLKPTFVTFDESAIDFESLVFLLDSEGGRSAIKHLKNAELSFRHLAYVHGRFGEAARELQTSLEPFMEGKNSETWARMEAHVGSLLIGRHMDASLGLIKFAEENPATNRLAFDSLTNELSRRFEKRVWSLEFEGPEGLEAAELSLPPLPAEVRAKLEGAAV